MTPEENELLMRTGTGSAMGSMMRQYWVPALRAARLEADGAPVRVRLFGEDYVAFRATDGRVGLFDEGCPHRCTSLALARNEDNALTCIFHGWKIDVSGKVVDVPSEPPERRAEFAAKVRVNHYPVREAAGMVWVWLAGGEQPAQFPNFEFAALPAEKVLPVSTRLNCNWLQVLELLLDPARQDLATRPLESVSANPPLIEVEATGYGLRGMASTRLPDGTRQARVIQWLAPGFVLLPAALDGCAAAACVVPVDDEQCLLSLVFYDRAKALDAGRLAAAGITVDDPDNFAAARGGATADFWRRGETGSRTAARSLLDDVVFPQAQGTMQNPGDQRLCSSDEMVSKARELLIEAVRAYRDGRPARDAGTPIDFGTIRAASGVLAAGADWRSL